MNLLINSSMIDTRHIQARVGEVFIMLLLLLLQLLLPVLLLRLLQLNFDWLAHTALRSFFSLSLLSFLVEILLLFSSSCVCIINLGDKSLF